MPWPYLPDDFDSVYDTAWVWLPNTLYDPVRGHDLYREYINTDSQTPAAAGTVKPDENDASVIFIQMPAGNITIANPANAQTTVLGPLNGPDTLWGAAGPAQ